MSKARRGRISEVAWVAALGLGASTVMLLGSPLPTTVRDFFAPGTQPLTLSDPMTEPQLCAQCHGFYDEDHEPYRAWAGNMMAQSARDPVFWAALAVANQDAAFAGEYCLRCHTPEGWLGGRSLPPDGSGLDGNDFNGVSCSTCHRMVDPSYKPGISPAEDQAILAALEHLPVNPHSGQYVIDPEDRRRGPRVLEDFFFHRWLHSPFHRDSAMCATCHEVSNPVFSRADDGRYVLNALDEPHETHDKYEQFPIERTYSEWLMSDFAKGPIDMGGRFGGNNRFVSSCQDCHMPDASGTGCDPLFGPEFRKDLATHHLAGANSWVLRAVRSLYPDDETGLTEELVEASIGRNIEMLRRAADLEAELDGSRLRVRVVNQSGHKLPTGYPEGRRMWVNVRFLDDRGALVGERGAYDQNEARLDAQSTKVYEAKLGLDETMSDLTGIPAGPSFHFVLNNKWYFDNRIPPRGFTNAAFELVQAAPVGYSYQDGQHWDDTLFDVPEAAVRAEVRLFHQTTTREYIEFLRDENRTNDDGRIAYEQWVLHGRSAPVEMALTRVDLEPCLPDINGDGRVDGADFLTFLSLFFAGSPEVDFDGNGRVDGADFLSFLSAFFAGC